jgi:hypothetical protein
MTVKVTQAARDAAADWYGCHAPGTASYEAMCLRFAKLEASAYQRGQEDMREKVVAFLEMKLRDSNTFTANSIVHQWTDAIRNITLGGSDE